MSVNDFIAMNRFGLGYGATDARRLIAGQQAWLASQIDSSAVLSFSSGLPPSSDLMKDIAALRGIKKDDEGNKGEKKEMRQEIRHQVLDANAARFAQAVTTQAPFAERLVLFWSNHFTVSYAGKPILAALTCAFENEAIRPHVFGRFEDMVLSVARHPAMMLYLDNATSVGPNSAAGQRRSAGLNENFARELMELHTLGVDGGYTQSDVTEMARILTGWTMVPKDGGGFVFVDHRHEPGARKVMGRTYPEGGEEQGLAAIHDLCSHPATARHIATKLARHFIADTPPQSAVNALAESFSHSGGDLKAVYRTLIALPESWQSPAAKVKTPYELVVSAFRALDIAPDKIPFQSVFGSLSLMGQRPFSALSPAGWPDTADDWLSSGILMTRIEWCHALAQRLPVTPSGSPLRLAWDTIGPVARPETMTWIERAPTPADGYAMVLASTEFQRR